MAEKDLSLRGSQSVTECYRGSLNMHGLQNHKTGPGQLESGAAQKAKMWVGILGHQVPLRGQAAQRTSQLQCWLVVLE